MYIYSRQISLFAKGKLSDMRQKERPEKRFMDVEG